MTGPPTAHVPAEEPRSIEVHAGPLTARLDRGALRWIKREDVEVVRGIYGAVRDPDWGTVPPRFDTYLVQRTETTFRVQFSAACVRELDGIDFVWQGMIDGSADGTISFTMDGVARAAFRCARIGLCVLHPLRLARQPVVVDSPWGSFSGVFPALVTHYLPFSNITRLIQEPGTELETVLSYEGDLFETEDQRSFGDASYKTFSRPLAQPWPVWMEAGATVHQRVTLRVPTRGTAPRLRTFIGSAIPPESVVIDATVRWPMPDIGAALPEVATIITDEIADRIRSLRLNYLRGTLEARDPNARARAKNLVEQARRLGVQLEAVILASPGDEEVGALLDTLAGAPVGRLVVLDRPGISTSAAVAGALRNELDRRGLRIELGGGTRAYLSQLLAHGLPTALLDFVVFPMNPQVHAFDDATIAENIEALPPMVETVRELAAGLPVHVGPISLRALFNPDQTGPESPPPLGELPSRYDRRQVSTFVAGWTIGCIAALARAGARAITLHEAAGWGGYVAAEQVGLPLPDRPVGRPYPVHTALAAVQAVDHGEVLSALAPSGIACLAIHYERGLRIVVANLRAVRVLVEFKGWQGRFKAARWIGADGNLQEAMAVTGDLVTLEPAEAVVLEA